MSVYFQKWRIGSHTQFEGNISDTVKSSIDFGMYAMQFFMGNPQSFTRTKISDSDIKKTLELLKLYPTDLFTHFPYVTNLAGSVSSLAWNGDSAQDQKTTIALKGLQYELDIMSNFEGGVVIHPGCYPDRKVGIETIAKSIDRLNFRENSLLLLENSAGQGNSIATTLQEIADIISLSKNKDNLGVCIDTCHLFAYGEYDIRDVNEVDRFFKDFEKIIGIEKLRLIHLNDSETPLKSRKDRHACIGTGEIWKESFTPLIYFLNRTKEYDIPLVLETSGSDMITLAQLSN